MSRVTKPKDLISSPQDFTTSWADLGPIIPCQNSDKILTRLGITVHDSTDLRVRVVDFAASGDNLPISGTSYIPQFDIHSDGNANYQIDDQYKEFTVDEDKTALLKWDVQGFCFAQFQIQAGYAATGSDTAATVTGALYNLVREY
jgi:hypothetical protein